MKPLSNVITARVRMALFFILLLLQACAPKTAPSAPPATTQNKSQLTHVKPISATRTDASIQRVFYRDTVKKPIYQLFLQQLKQDPAFAGSVEFKISVDRYGKVQRCDLVKTITADKQLEQDTCQIIMKTDFGEVRDPRPVVFYYPIDFLPN